MQTLHHLLTSYCKENNLVMPSYSFQTAMGLAVVNTLKQTDKYVGIEKISLTVEMEVNNYPDELVPVINTVIADFFAGKFKGNKIVKNGAVVKKVKKLNYEIEEHKAAAFEAALTATGFTILPNKQFGCKNGKVQYAIEIINAARLITLGKNFQKQRQLQKKQYYLQKQKEASDKSESSQPHTVIPAVITGTTGVKKERRRIPIANKENSTKNTPDGI